MRRNLVKILAVVLAISVLATVSFAANKLEKPKKIVAFLDTTMIGKDAAQDKFCDEFKKQTGIELQIIQPVHNQYYEKLRLAFASGDFPDVVEISELNYVNFSKEGAFVDLDPYVKKSAALKKVDKKQLDALRINKKLYGFPTQVGTGPITYIRKDWLDNLHLAAPKTWDELYKVMKAFTQNDPDKNGKNDTYAITGPGATGDNAITLADNYYRDFFQNASPEFIMKNGKWVDGFMQPEIKGALERLRKCYQEKLIDPEIFTNQTSTCRDKFTSGKCGIFTYWYGSWNVNLDNQLQKNLGAKAKVLPIPAIKGSYYIARVPTVNAITAKSKYPEAVFKFFVEYMHDSGPGQMLFTHGVEGVHWAKKDGVYKMLPSLVNPKIAFSKSYIPQEASLTAWKDPFVIDERVTNSKNLFFKNYKQALLQPMPNIREKVEPQIINAKNEVIGKVLTGAWTVDQGLAYYKKRAAELGLTKVLDAMNQEMAKK